MENELFASKIGEIKRKLIVAGKPNKSFAVVFKFLSALLLISSYTLQNFLAAHTSDTNAGWKTIGNQATTAAIAWDRATRQVARTDDSIELRLVEWGLRDAYRELSFAYERICRQHKPECLSPKPEEPVSAVAFANKGSVEDVIVRGTEVREGIASLSKSLLENQNQAAFRNRIATGAFSFFYILGMILLLFGFGFEWRGVSE